MKKPFFRRLVASLSAFALVMPASLAAAGEIIRDAEIENSILAWSTPIFITAGLNQKAVSLYIVNDRELNAFVSGGQNVFLTTGLLMRSENYTQVVGVV
ncbi:MAG: M48 family metalloprotease, partial [Rhodospirillaceae bacterium]|nr:M48 family metalloprotease [Rhodospirillaceae bacterium]